MSLTLDHVREWCAEAGRPLKRVEGRLEAQPGQGGTIVWRLGPALHWSTCSTCGAEISGAETVVAMVGRQTGANHPWDHVRCFDWSARPLVCRTGYTRRRPRK